jgi:hypothetical protein
MIVVDVHFRVGDFRLKNVLSQFLLLFFIPHMFRPYDDLQAEIYNEN